MKQNAPDTKKTAPDLVTHYRPLRLKAIVAATTIKACSSDGAKQSIRGTQSVEPGRE